MANFKMDPDYKEVAERLDDLFAKYPDARMRGSYQVVEVAGLAFIAYTAECYRTADDPMPAQGTAWEPVPGTTSFTKSSELQNAETSAWGRAIVAAGASRSKRIASADEIRNARAHQEPRRGSATGTTSAPPQEERTQHPHAASDETNSAISPSPPPGASSPYRLHELKKRYAALGDVKKVQQHQKNWALPNLTAHCTDAELTRWDELLTELEAVRPVPA